MTRDRRGIALALALAVVVLAGWFAALGLIASETRVRLAADDRWSREGALVVESALATTRVAHRTDLDTLHDSSAVDFPPVERADGWRWQASAWRDGALIRLIAVAQRHAADGTLAAARRASLLLIRDSADTVRVFGDHPRF